MMIADMRPVEATWLREMVFASEARFAGGVGQHCAAGIGLAAGISSVEPHEDLGFRRQGNLWAAADLRLDDRQALAETLDAGVEVSDTELVLKAYQRWGEACPGFLTGDFAFAIWHVREQSLFCVRDPIGARPFHYHASKHRFAFGSELRQLAAITDMPKGLDGYAISDFLSFALQHQARTLWSGIQKLLPGHALIVHRDGRCRAWRYWQPATRQSVRYRQPEDYCEHFRELLERSVWDRLNRLKGPAAIKVSGGIDSSAVGLIARKLFDTGRLSFEPSGFHFGFDELRSADEGEYVQALQQQTNFRIYRIAVEPHRYFPEQLEAREMPSFDSPAYPLEELNQALYRRLREGGFQCLLTGFGGDSLFDGARLGYYDAARQGDWRTLMAWVRAGRRRGWGWWTVLRSLVLKPWVPYRLLLLLDRYSKRWRMWHSPPWLSPSFVKRAGTEERLRQRVWPGVSRSLARQAQFEHLVGLAQQGPLIEEMDQAVQRHGLTASYPLLDRRLAEFVLAAPVELGHRPEAAGTKWLLRQAAGDLLPSQVKNRTDKGNWGPYFERVLRAEALPLLNGFEQPLLLEQYGLVDADRLCRDLDLSLRGRGFSSYNIFFPPILLEIWLRRYIGAHRVVHFDELAPWQREGGGTGSWI